MPDAAFTPLGGCRVCGAGELFPVLDLGRQPLANALELPGDAGARYPLAVVGCPGCGVLQLDGTVDPHAMFDDYLYFSSYSASMVSAMKQLAAQLVHEHALTADDLVVEVASNDGYLLQHYRDLGTRVLGIEPAANVALVAQEAGIETRVEYFTPAVAAELRAAGQAPKIVHVNNVIAHVPDIHAFVEAIALLVPEDGIAVVETPSLVDLVDRALFETIYHEHVFYYSLSALGDLFGRHGMVVEDCEHLAVHGGSLRVTFRRSTGGGAGPAPRAVAALEAEVERGLTSPEGYRAFATEVAACRQEVAAGLAAVKDAGRSLAGYGAAAKATVLLNFVGADAGALDYVVDLNPAKQGRVIPGTGVPVVPLQRLRDEPPDVLAVLVWNLADEVRGQLEWYTAAGGQLVVPLEERRRVDRGGGGRPAAADPG